MYRWMKGFTISPLPFFFKKKCGDINFMFSVEYHMPEYFWGQLENLIINAIHKTETVLKYLNLTLAMLTKLKCHAHFCQPIRLIQIHIMTNGADLDQLASKANWSGSTVFAKVCHIRVQQDQG